MSELPPPFDGLQEALAGRYSLERVLDDDGTLVRVRARDVALDRPVVLLVVGPKQASDPEVRGRFLDAARRASGLFHPNILPVHAVDEVPGAASPESSDPGPFAFAVTTLVDGETLAERVERAGPLTPTEVRRLVEDVAWALSHAHARGVVHGDLGPRSLVLEPHSGRTVVADFGISRAAGGADPDWHVPPEVRRGDPPDARADLFGLGATARYALTGRDRTSGKVDEQLWDDADRFPPRLVNLLRECLRAPRRQRPGSALALAQAAAEEGVVPATLPPSVHRLLRQIRRFSPVAGIGVLLLWFLRGGALELITAPLIALIFGVMGVGLLRSAREVLREGLDAELITFILEEEAMAMVAGEDAPARDFQNFAIGCGTFMFVLGVIPFSILLVATVWSVLTGGGIVGVAAWSDMSVAGLLLCTFLFLAGPILPRDSPLRSLDWGERMMVGRFGRLLFRLAGVGLGWSPRGLLSKRSAGEELAPLELAPRVGAAEVGQPTEALLAAESEALFRALPREVRRRFPEVPQALEDLRGHVAWMSRQDEKLARMIGSRGGSPPEDARGEDAETVRQMQVMRDRARGRIREAVAAMEHLRLHMLQMAAGGGAESELTVDLERARALKVELDALVEADREVERTLLGRAPRGGNGGGP